MNSRLQCNISRSSSAVNIRGKVSDKYLSDGWDGHVLMDPTRSIDRPSGGREGGRDGGRQACGGYSI